MTGDPSSTIWHPFTQHALRGKFAKIKRAQGAYLETTEGERIIDAISSWWVVTHGHRHPHIVAAIQAQAEELGQVIFAEYSHEPAERLAAKLIGLMPDGLEHVFFSDSGSTSVEVALKMALVYWRHRGRPRHRIIVMKGGYHGDTFGAMSVGTRGIFTLGFERLLFDVAPIPFPAQGAEEVTLQALAAICQQENAAALIVEPLVLGAGGTRMYSPKVLADLKRICDRYEVLFIADEVMTGWGRTGTMFACEQAVFTPDIACYSKGLTNGSLPLAVTMCRHEIFEAHYSEDRQRTLFHSSSFTANPIACVAALANLEVWEQERVHAKIAALELLQAEQLNAFRDDARFDNIRQTGTITAMDLNVRDRGYLSDVGPWLSASFRASSVLLRPLGNTIYVLPPYCVTREDLSQVYGAIRTAVDALGRT